MGLPSKIAVDLSAAAGTTSSAHLKQSSFDHTSENYPEHTPANFAFDGVKTFI
jgi:hypothetical protein